jgi:hypothetical protein
MATVTDVCHSLVEGLPGALACSVVDSNSGMLVGVHHMVPHFTPEYLDAIAAAAVEMFCGRTVRRVEEILSSLRGTPVKDSFEEIFISSPAVFHFMKLIREKQAIAVLVTRKNVSQGLGWAALRNTIPKFLTALP